MPSLREPPRSITSWRRSFLPPVKYLPREITHGLPRLSSKRSAPGVHKLVIDFAGWRLETVRRTAREKLVSTETGQDGAGDKEQDQDEQNRLDQRRSRN